MALDIYRGNTQLAKKNFVNAIHNPNFRMDVDGGKRIINNFMNANPNLKNDSYIFTLLNMSAALIPIASTVSAYAAYWAKSKFLSATFKRKYIQAINRDKSLVALINGLGLKTSNIDSKTLKQLSTLAINQSNANTRELARMNMMNAGARTNTAAALRKAKSSKHSEIVLYAYIFRTLALLLVMGQAMMYVAKVSYELGNKSTVNSENFLDVVNTVARFVFVLSNTVIPVALAGAQVVFMEFGRYMSGTSMELVNMSVGVLSSAAVKFALDKYMIDILYQNIGSMIFWTQSVTSTPKNNFLIKLLDYGATPAMKDAAIDSVNNVFRLLRDSLLGFSATTQKALITGIVASIGVGGASFRTRNRQIRAAEINNARRLQ